MRGVLVVALDGFNESDHPRDAEGKFGSGGGSSSLKSHPPERMREYTPKELDWEYEVEYRKYARPSFPNAFSSRQDFQEKYDAAPTRALSEQELRTLGNSMAASGIGKNEDWVHRTFGHRRDSKRIVEALRSGKTAPPIILKSGNRLHLMAGQTRLAAGMALGVSVPAKVIDVTRKLAGDDFNEADHPRDLDGKFASGGGAGGAAKTSKPFASVGQKATPGPGVTKALKTHGFKEDPNAAETTFIHESGAKVIVHKSKTGAELSGTWTHEHEGTKTPGTKGGALGALLAQAVEKAKSLSAKAAKQNENPVVPMKVGESVKSPAQKPTPLGVTFTDAISGKGYAHLGVSAEGDAIYTKPTSGARIQMNPSTGAWIATTPGFTTKKGVGAENLEKLLSGKPAVMEGGKYPWENAPGVTILTKAEHADVGAKAAAVKAQQEAIQKAAAEAAAKNKAATEAALAKYNALKAVAPQPTPQQSTALSNYGGNGYANINTTLRKRMNLSGALAKHVEEIDTYLEGSALPEEIVLYRGVKGDYAEVLLSIIMDQTKFRDLGFISTSSRDLGWGELTMEITVPAGSKGAAIGQHSGHHGEHEVLLPRDSALIVTSFDPVKKRMKVRLDQSHL